MIAMLHFDGFILAAACVAAIFVGQSYHRWMFRVPIFALAFCYFCLAVSMLGRQNQLPVAWFYARPAADSLALVLAVLHVRYGHAAAAGYDRMRKAEQIE